ncbi:MAG: TIGR03016 family PEP-CTERM system-associated outer membrane protein [Gammaproteobacteria bacterium]|nr:TIGR03016 family PEP-CTERM system-associated outer membrane protein [Gammaproteobacteria bacterium]
MLMPSLGFAAQWRLTPSIELVETYTDNVTLSSDANSESDLISQINPALSLTGKGRELELAFDYRMQNLFYLGDSDRNNTNHQLNAGLKATLAPDWLFLDASSTLSQQVLSPDDNVSLGNIGVVSGREDVLTTRVSPYIQTRVTQWTVADLRYSQDSVSYSGEMAEDSTSEQVSASLQSAKSFGSWTWGVRYTEQTIDYSELSVTQNREDVKRRDTVLDLGYQLSPRIRLTGQTGYEDNEYQLSADAETPEGEYWSLGTVWTPSSQTSITASGGRRFFGRTWALDWSHQARRHGWQLAYNEDLSSRRELQLEQFTFIRVNPDGTIYTDPITLSPVISQRDILVATDEVFIERRASFHWTMRHRKSTSTFQVNRSRREFQETSVTEITSGVDLGWNLQISRSEEFSANLGRQNTEREIGDDRYTIAGVSYEKQLGKSVNSTFEMRNVRRNGSGAGNDYVENQLSAGITMHW